MKIISDKKWHNFLYGYEVPKKIINSFFDYLSADEIDSGSFLKYKDRYYYMGEFQTTSGLSTDAFMKNWDGYASDSFFSGVLIKISQDGEQYKIGRYIS